MVGVISLVCLSSYTNEVQGDSLVDNDCVNYVCKFCNLHSCDRNEIIYHGPNHSHDCPRYRSH